MRIQVFISPEVLPLHPSNTHNTQSPAAQPTQSDVDFEFECQCHEQSFGLYGKAFVWGQLVQKDQAHVRSFMKKTKTPITEI